MASGSMTLMNQIGEIQTAECDLVFVAEGEHFLDGVLSIRFRINRGCRASFDDLLNVAVKRHTLRLRFAGKLRLDFWPQLDLNHSRNSLLKLYHIAKNPHG
jgi:hypothetical protein